MKACRLAQRVAFLHELIKVVMHHVCNPALGRNGHRNGRALLESDYINGSFQGCFGS